MNAKSRCIDKVAELLGLYTIREMGNQATEQPSNPATDPAKIRAMFASIAARYDRANTILSAGVHHHWRRRAVSRANAKEGDEVLDCATGTGDLAIAFRRAVGTTGRVLGTDV